MATFFDPAHLSWPFVLVPGVVIALVVSADNKYVGKYFALADAVFNKYGNQVRWSNREIRGKLIRRACWLIVFGFILAFIHYRAADIAGVFLIVGLLMIWPAFFHPLPSYDRVSGFEVVCLWVTFVISCVGFGLAGASIPPLMHAISGEASSKLIKENLAMFLISIPVSIVFTALWFPIQNRIQRQRSD